MREQERERDREREWTNASKLNLPIVKVVQIANYDFAQVFIA